MLVNIHIFISKIKFKVVAKHYLTLWYEVSIEIQLHQLAHINLICKSSICKCISGFMVPLVQLSLTDVYKIAISIALPSTTQLSFIIMLL